jgi:hypothetical protein
MKKVDMNKIKGKLTQIAIKSLSYETLFFNIIILKAGMYPLLIFIVNFSF